MFLDRTNGSEALGQHISGRPHKATRTKWPHMGEHARGRKARQINTKAKTPNPTPIYDFTLRHKVEYHRSYDLPKPSASTYGIVGFHLRVSSSIKKFRIWSHHCFGQFFALIPHNGDAETGNCPHPITLPRNVPRARQGEVGMLFVSVLAPPLKNSS